MTKAKLKSKSCSTQDRGVFGRMSNGKWFVIVNGLIVYENGGCDTLSFMDDNLSLEFYRIDFLAFVQSFDQAKAAANNPLYGLFHPYAVLYDRNTEETVMTIAEIEKKLGIKNLEIKGA